MKTKGNIYALTKEEREQLRKEAKSDRKSMRQLTAMAKRKGALVEDESGAKLFIQNGITLLNF